MTNEGMGIYATHPNPTLKGWLLHINQQTTALELTFEKRTKVGGLNHVPQHNRSRERAGKGEEGWDSVKGGGWKFRGVPGREWPPASCATERRAGQRGEIGGGQWRRV